MQSSECQTYLMETETLKRDSGKTERTDWLNILFDPQQFI